MTTLDDQASDREQLDRDLAQRKPAGPAATGYCLNCGEPVDGRWCNPECREDWSKREGQP